MNLNHSEKWVGGHPSGLKFEIVRHMVGSPINQGRGAWCFYVYIRENQTNRFEEIWLPDKIAPLMGGGREWLTHDYSECALASAKWHCGITFYEKGNHQLMCQRYVKAGCDYSHYWDEGKHDLYDVGYVANEAMECCDSLVDILNIKPKEAA
jgi:hypothetical protein